MSKTERHKIMKAFYIIIRSNYFLGELFKAFFTEFQSLQMLNKLYSILANQDIKYCDCTKLSGNCELFFLRYSNIFVK